MDRIVRAALPVKRETLYDADDPNRASEDQQMKRPRVWEEDSDQAASKTRKIADDLASLYRPPTKLMFQGSFHESKQFAQRQQKWLLLNLQSATEFSSHTLNRDTWGNEIVAEMIASNFIFWQVYDDTAEGLKVCSYYEMMDSVPAVLVLDPFTGEQVRSWRGMVQPEALLEDLVPYMDAAPKGVVEELGLDAGPKLPVARPVRFIKLRAMKGNTDSETVIPVKRNATLVPYETTEEDEEVMALATSIENMTATGDPTSNDAKESKNEEVEMLLSKKLGYLELTEEPEVDKELVCTIRIRLPDGRRVQRSFLRADPVQLLWPFCSSQLDAAEFPTFDLKLAIPGASKTLNCENKMTFGESGLSNSLISVTWDRA